jgi:hypothetical protein
MTCLSRVLVPILCAAAISGCASSPPANPVNPESIVVYDPLALRQGSFERVRRLWIESRESAYFYPRFKTAEEGLAALKKEAARLGASGLYNTFCLLDTKGFGGAGFGPYSFGPYYFCGGDAITLKSASANR